MEGFAIFTQGFLCFPQPSSYNNNKKIPFFFKITQDKPLGDIWKNPGLHAGKISIHPIVFP